MSESTPVTNQPNGKSCPDCGEAEQVKRQNFSLLKTLSLGFLGDLGALLVAIILFAAISALSFTGAYGIAVIVVIGGGIILLRGSRGYKCTKCDRIFSK